MFSFSTLRRKGEKVSGRSSTANGNCSASKRRLPRNTLRVAGSFCSRKVMACDSYQPGVKFVVTWSMLKRSTMLGSTNSGEPSSTIRSWPSACNWSFNSCRVSRRKRSRWGPRPVRLHQGRGLGMRYTHSRVVASFALANAGLSARRRSVWNQWSWRMVAHAAGDVLVYAGPEITDRP